MLISNYLNIQKGIVLADILECVVMSLFMIFTSWEDLVTSSSVLVLGISDDLAQEIKTAMKRVSMLDGVVSMQEPRYWIESPGCLIGMITVVATQDADVKQMRTKIQGICSHTFKEIAIQIDQQPSYGWMSQWITS